MTERDDNVLFRAVHSSTPAAAVDELLAELDLLALADAVGVLRVRRPVVEGSAP